MFSPNSNIVEFLRDVLADGPLPTNEIETRARGAGLLREVQRIAGSKPFKRAKQFLGIRSVRSGFGSAGAWLWILDKQALQSNAITKPAVSTEGEDDQLSAGRRAQSAWAEGVARLGDQSPSNEIPLHRWRQFLADCNNFLGSSDNWAERAAGLDWDGLSLFGCHRDRPLMYLGRAGLVWAINGGRVVKLERDWACIELPDGSERVFHRRRQDPAVVTLPWVGFRRRANR